MRKTFFLLFIPLALNALVPLPQTNLNNYALKGLPL
jgi:hypothetical protein